MVEYWRILRIFFEYYTHNMRNTYYMSIMYNIFKLYLRVANFNQIIFETNINEYNSGQKSNITCILFADNYI